MSHPGMGVMLGYLGGNAETVEAFKGAIGKTVANAKVDAEANGGDGALLLRFTDGSGIQIYDAGRSCCESRYITCDDDLGTLAGGKLSNIELKPGPDEEADYETHETTFVEVQTDRASVTLTTHNEHNGYYGGFYFEVRSLASAIEAPSGVATAQTGSTEGESATRRETPR